MGAEIANKDGLEVLPHPKEFLGDLVKDLNLAEKTPTALDSDSDTDDSEDADGQKVLRETVSDAYRTFLRYFGGCGMTQSRWRTKSVSLLYHELVNPTMEAFLVLCYVNVWSCAVSINTHANNRRVTHPGHAFTSEGKGSPLRGGWSKESRDIYLNVVKKIRDQRAADRHHRFDMDLMDLLQRNYRCARSRGSENVEEVECIDAFADFIQV